VHVSQLSLTISRATPGMKMLWRERVPFWTMVGGGQREA
jgi:hypothetical protein